MRGRAVSVIFGIFLLDAQLQKASIFFGRKTWPKVGSSYHSALIREIVDEAFFCQAEAARGLEKISPEKQRRFLARSHLSAFSSAAKPSNMRNLCKPKKEFAGKIEIKCDLCTFCPT